MCVLGWISTSHAINGNEIQNSGCRGSAGNIEKLGFFNSCKSKTHLKIMKAWCHDMAPTCCGNFFGRIGTSFGVSFLQTEASLKKARGSERECVTSMCETTYVHYLNLFGLIYSGFVWPFLYINWISSHLMCIIQIWTTSTCSSAPKLVKKSHVCPWVNF